MFKLGCDFELVEGENAKSGIILGLCYCCRCLMQQSEYVKEMLRKCTCRRMERIMHGPS